MADTTLQDGWDNDDDDDIDVDVEVMDVNCKNDFDNHAASAHSNGNNNNNSSNNNSNSSNNNMNGWEDDNNALLLLLLDDDDDDEVPPAAAAATTTTTTTTTERTDPSTGNTTTTTTTTSIRTPTTSNTSRLGVVTAAAAASAAANIHQEVVPNDGWDDDDDLGLDDNDDNNNNDHDEEEVEDEDNNPNQITNPPLLNQITTTTTTTMGWEEHDHHHHEEEEDDDDGDKGSSQNMVFHRDDDDDVDDDDDDDDLNFDDYAPKPQSPLRRTKQSIDNKVWQRRRRHRNDQDDLNFDEYAPTGSPRHCKKKAVVIATTTTTTAAAATAIKKDGWDDDEDALDNLDNNSSSSSSSSSGSSSTNKDDEHLDEKPAAVPYRNVLPKRPVPAPPPPPRVHHPPHPHHHHKVVAMKIEDKEMSAEGWEDDFFDFDIDEDENIKVPSQPENLPQPQQQQQHHPPPARQKSKLHTDLEVYLDQLDHLQSSINAVMQYEYNTAEKAQELIKYYGERPRLTHYTIQKELPRMEYGVIVGSPAGGRGPLVTDKAEIARIFHQDQTLLSRCANQSLLADLLQAFTGHDMLVRPQFLTTAIATSCRFLVDYSSLSVQAEALLDLSLPTVEKTGRWKIADIHVRVTARMNPQEPHVEYILMSIRPTVRDNSWNASLDSAVEVLNGLNPEEMERGMHFDELPGMNFRDAFLQQTQNLVQNSAVGFKSALKDIESVAGIGSKLNQIPAFLPDDILQAAAEQHHTHSPPKARPTSILGGLVSKLAKSVALPDEDPSLYDNWSPSSLTEQPSRPPPPPRPPPPKPAPSATVPRLYNRPDDEEEEDVQPPADVPKLYNRPDEAARPLPASIPRLYNRPEQDQVSQRSPPRGSRPLVQSTSQQQQQQQQQRPDQPHCLIAAVQPVESNSAQPKRPRPPPPPPPTPSVTPTLTEQRAEGPPMAGPNIAARPVLFSASTEEKRQSMSVSPSRDRRSDRVVQDGWGSDDVNDEDLEFEVEEEVGKPGASSPGDKPSPDKFNRTMNVLGEQQEVWTYNPQVDIIPSRKRWVHPRPGMRELVGSSV